MLVLSRKSGESLIVGDEVKVTVLGVSGRQVRIGIDAPNDVAVHRQEVFDRIRRETPQGISADEPNDTRPSMLSTVSDNDE